MTFADKTQLLDLTHSLSGDIPGWDRDCCFSMNIACDYDDCKAPNLFRIQKISGKAGCGTHIDSPAHCFAGAKTTDAIELEKLMTDCMVIHVSGADENTVVLPDAVVSFEKTHGTIPTNAFVIVHTGWDAHWGSPEKYRNELRFPSIHEDTAKLLLERGVAGIGIDTLSPDAGGKDFPVHRVMLGAGKYLVENVANAGELPPTGARVLIAPMKIAGATEAPVRLLAFLQ